jgi:hypothetical protein
MGCEEPVCGFMVMVEIVSGSVGQRREAAAEADWKIIVVNLMLLTAFF